MADNVRPSSVPIILAPSPALSARPLSSPQGSRSSTPTDPGPKQIEMSEEARVGDNHAETSDSEPGQPATEAQEKPKASIYDI